MAKVKVKIDIDKLDSTNGSYNENLKNLCVQAVISGAKTESDTDFVTYTIDSKNLPMALAKTIIAIGADEVKGFPFFIKVNPSDSVPSSLPESTFIDEENVVQAKTWTQWKLAHFEFHTLSDGNTYIAGEAYSTKEVILNNFSAVFDDCIDVETFKGLQIVE